MNMAPRRNTFTPDMGPDFTRELPNNLEAEQALLGALMVNNDVLDVIRAPIAPAHFYEPLHGEIFEAVSTLVKAGRKASPITVKALVRDIAVGEKTMAQYLTALCFDAAPAINVPDISIAIIECAARRAVLSLGERMESVGRSSDLDIMDEFEALRAKFDDVSAALRGEERAKTLADAAVRSLAATALAYQGKGLSGVDYGVSFLMRMIGPLLAGQLLIMGGMTKHGKSSLIEQMIAGAAMNGHAVWVNSGEMKDEELARRAMARLTDIKAWQQVRGKVSTHDYERLEIARRNAERWQERVFIRDDTMTLRQIERDITEFAKHHPGGMAVVDHVGLVEKDFANARTNDAEFSSIVTRKLKVFAGNNKLPIVAAVQLKKNIFEITDRSITRKTFMKVIGRRPKAADLFGSCEKDADYVITPFRAEAVMDENEPAEADDLHSVWEEVMDGVRNKAEIVLALSRHCKWPQRQEVVWNGPRTQFEPKNDYEQARMPV